MREKFAERGRDPYDGLRFYSALTHGVGAALAGLGMAILLVAAAQRQAPGKVVAAMVVYTLSMLLLYTASTVYHSVRTSVIGRNFLRKLDHVMIYLLIAGTYTPMCVIALGNTAVGNWMLAAIWLMAALGTTLTLLWIKMPRALTSGIYIVMGWFSVLAIVPLHQRLSTYGFAMLLAGGVLYTIGGVLYALKWPGRNNPRFGCHEIFHVFIVLGSVCHFLMIYQLLG